MIVNNNKRSQLMKILIPISVVAGVCALILLITNELTQSHIADNAREQQLRIINTVMPLPHDNALYDDTIEVVDPHYLGSENSVSVFRARNADQPVGLVLMPVTAKGYSGNILLTIGIAYDGTLLGVQVLKHQETEGLGGEVDQKKSDWIKGFIDRSLANTSLEIWTVKTDGGAFDQLSGATITSRNVINTVRKSLEYYQINRDKLYLDQ